jgi:hypothetical protein
MGKLMKRHPNKKRQIREPPNDNFDSSKKIFSIIVKEKWRLEPTQKNGATSEKPNE